MIKNLDARRAVEILVNGPESGRFEVIRRLGELDQGYMRQLITQHLLGDHAPGKELEVGESYIYWVRSWLTNALPQLKGNDQATRDLIQKHLDPGYEPQEWVRHWTLEGMIVGQAPELLDTAKAVAARDPSQVVKKLAEAVLAGSGDAEARNAILDALRGTDTALKWATLRAIRVIWIPAAAPALVDILKQDWAPNLSYDAVIAAGRVPPNFGMREDIADIVSDKVRQYRNAPVYDGIRIKALRTLGQLKVESTAPRLLECLLDDNPAIVREAIFALTEVLGLATAMTRIGEEVVKRGEDRLENYVRALSWLEDRKQVVEELDRLQESVPLEHQDLIRRLLMDVGGLIAFKKLDARERVRKDYKEELSQSQSKIDDTFEKSIRNAQQGFRITQIMDVTVFVIGVALIGIAVYILLAQPDRLQDFGGTTLTVGSGLVGVLAVIYATWFAKPREKIREAVKDLMEMRVVFQAFLRQLHQTDQAYARRLIDDEPITSTEAREFTQLIRQIMSDAITELNRGSAATDGANGGPSAPGLNDDEDDEALPPGADGHQNTKLGVGG